MEILVVTENFLHGGLETHITTLAKELNRIDVKTHLLVGSYLSNESAFSEFKCYKSFPELIGIDSLQNAIEASKGLIQYVRLNKIQLIHSHPFLSIFPAFIAAKVCNIPFFVTIHGPGSLTNYPNSLKSFFYECVLPAADAVFVVSKEVLDLAQGLVASKNFMLVPNLVEFVDPSVPKSDETKKWAVIGRIEDGKEIGFLDFVKQAHFLGVSCVDIIGDGNKRNALEEEVSDLNLNIKVNFLGWIHDPFQESSDYDVIGGMGRVVLEVIARNHVSVLVGYDGVKTVLTVENIDHASLSNFSGRNLNNTSITSMQISMQKSNTTTLRNLVQERHSLQKFTLEIKDGYLKALHSLSSRDIQFLDFLFLIQEKADQLLVSENRVFELEESMSEKADQLLVSENRVFELEESMSEKADQLLVSENRVLELEESMSEKADQLLVSENRVLELEESSLLKLVSMRLSFLRAGPRTN
jgi:glycosyltransferase involved in cell wall biosynthesis